jgi:predicted acetyltransferase
MEVNLTRARGDERQIVDNMFTAYFYDLSQYDDYLLINAHGLPVWALDGQEPEDGPRTHEECRRFNWWVRDTCELYVIRADSRPAGFVIICPAPAEHMPVGIDYELMDFYIAPKYRRRGVGARAARLAFDLHRGAWVVYQLERNLAARTFWQRAVGEYTGGRFENHQAGTEQRFRNDW